MIVKFPQGRHAGLIIDVNVQQVDILPTVLAIAGAVVPAGLDGIPLLQAANRPERHIVSYLKMDAHDVMSAVYGDRQYILWRASLDNPSEELLPFGPGASREERSHLAYDKLWRRELEKTLRTSFQQAHKVQVPQVPIDGELAKQLRALEYLR